MTKKNDLAKLKAFRCFAEGLSPYQIRNNFDVAQKTIYLWHDEWKKSQGDVLPTTKEQVQAIQCEWENWGKWAEGTSQEICTDNADLRSRAKDLLLRELSHDYDLNFRAISTLNNLLDSLEKRLYQWGQVENLNINKAFKRLETEGYLVQDPNLLESSENEISEAETLASQRFLSTKERLEFMNLCQSKGIDPNKMARSLMLDFKKKMEVSSGQNTVS